MSSNTASTSFLEPCSRNLARDEFTARIASWAKGVEPTTPQPEQIVSRTTRTKARQSKPYARPAPEAPQPSHSSTSLERSPVSVLPDPHQLAILDLRNAMRLDRSLRSLPHPKDNPLITRCPDDLQEEYARIVLLYNTVEEKKQPIELRWLQRPSVSIMKELDAMESASQRIINSAQYLVDFAYALRLEINFQEIFLRYRSTPKPASSNNSQSAEVKNRLRHRRSKSADLDRFSYLQSSGSELT